MAMEEINAKKNDKHSNDWKHNFETQNKIVIQTKFWNECVIVKEKKTVNQKPVRTAEENCRRNENPNHRRNEIQTENCKKLLFSPL